MEFELEFTDYVYDDGYGEKQCDVIVVVEVSSSRQRIGTGDAYRYYDYDDVRVEFAGATVFMIGNNAEELGQAEVSKQWVKDHIGWDIVEKAAVKEYDREA